MDCAVTAERTTKESAADTASLACYGTAHGHLIDLLLRHDWLLQRYIARSGPRKPDDILGFAAISRQEVERHLGHSADCAESAAAVLAIDETLQDLERLIDEKVKRSRAQGMRLPLVELARRFALGAREIDLLFVAVAVEIDRRYERVYGFLHDDMSRKLPSPALALGLYCENVADQLEMRELLSSQSALRHYRLIELVDDGAALPWLSRSMRVDARILGFLLGESAIDARVSRSVTWMAGGVESASQNLPPRAAVEELIEQVSSWSGDAQSRGKPLIYLLKRWWARLRGGWGCRFWLLIARRCWKVASISSRRCSSRFAKGCCGRHRSSCAMLTVCWTGRQARCAVGRCYAALAIWVAW
jgi:hypothetical protein